MAKAKMKINYELEYYAAFDRRGQLLTATICKDKAEATRRLERFNPRIEGYEYDFEVLPIMIGIDTRESQHELFAALD